MTKSVWHKLIVPLLLLAAALLLFYFLRDIDGLHISFPELAAVPEDIRPEAGTLQGTSTVG